MSEATPTKIEVTPEMIEAGARILRDCFDAGWSSSASFAVEIFEAMISASAERLLTLTVTK